MRVLRHKSIDVTLDEIMEMIETEKVTGGIAINIHYGDITTIVAEPEDCMNIFGELTEDYEIIYYDEDEN